MPADAEPGSLDKLNHMSERVARGLPVFHSEDKGAWHAAEYSGLAAELTAKAQQGDPVKDDMATDELWDLEKEVRAKKLVTT
jgi:hypothetical protein